jgi:hypothetical protein
MVVRKAMVFDSTMRLCESYHFTLSFGWVICLCWKELRGILEQQIASCTPLLNSADTEHSSKRTFQFFAFLLFTDWVNRMDWLRADFVSGQTNAHILF